MIKKIKNRLIFELKSAFLIILGVFSVAFGIGGFLIPNGFLDGGVSGIALLIYFLTPVNLSLLIFLINLPFIFIAKKQIGRSFAIKTFLAVSLLSLILMFVNFPQITLDKLLAPVFGGVFIGGGIGLSIRGGSVLDGAEIISAYLNKKTNFTIGEIILFINVLIFTVAGFLLSVETALYSIITYFVASKTIDLVSQGFEAYKGITIISNKSGLIKKTLLSELGKGVTVYKGKKGRVNSEEELEILFTIVTRLDVIKIKNHVLEIDPEAVLIEQNVYDLEGGYINRRKPKIK